VNPNLPLDPFTRWTTTTQSPWRGLVHAGHAWVLPAACSAARSHWIYGVNRLFRLERRREIGIRMALGAQPQEVTLFFVRPRIFGCRPWVWAFGPRARRLVVNAPDVFAAVQGGASRPFHLLRGGVGLVATASLEATAVACAAAVDPVEAYGLK